MSPPTTINIRVAELRKLGYTSLREWLNDPHHMYIARNMSAYVDGATQSKWHNPFPLKHHPLPQSLKLYENHIRDSDLYNHLHELNGMVLGCWCKDMQNWDVVNCHGDVLRKLYIEKYGNK